MLKYAVVVLILKTSFAFANGGAADSSLALYRGAVLNLDTLIAEAMLNNPELMAARHKTAASRASVDRVTSWEAPQVGVEWFRTPVQSFPSPFRDGTQTNYFIQQMFPFPGKLSAMGRAAEDNSRMVEQGYKGLERKIVHDLKSAYYNLYLVQRKIEINAENQDLMRRFVDIATKRYEVGQGGQPDILRAQTELSTLITDGLNLEDEKQSAEAMLNTILNRPVNAPLGYIASIEKRLPPWTFEQLRPLAMENRPEVRAMSLGVEKNAAELDASRKEYFPNLMVRVTYKDMANTSNDFWATMVGVSIPIAPWSSGSVGSNVEEKELNVKKAEEDFTAMKNMTLFQVHDALVKVRTNQNVVMLYKNTTVPQAEQTLQSTIAAYQTGKTEFLMLIDAYRMLLMTRLDFYMAVMNYMSSQAYLEQAVGLDLDEIAKRIQ